VPRGAKAQQDTGRRRILGQKRLQQKIVFTTGKLAKEKIQKITPNIQGRVLIRVYGGRRTIELCWFSDSEKK